MSVASVIPKWRVVDSSPIAIPGHSFDQKNKVDRRDL